MFGKPEWFTMSACCKGVSPVSWKGWLYFAAAGAVMIFPMIALGMAGKAFPEALIWAVVAGLAFLWDTRAIRRQLQTERDRNLLYIDGSEDESPQLATRHFDMKLRG